MDTQNAKPVVQNETMDVMSADSQKRGVLWLFETILRKFKILVHVISLMPIYALGAIVLGLAASPAVLMVRWVYSATGSWPWLLQGIGLSISGALGYFVYGYSLLLLVPVINRVLGMHLKQWRGPYYSWESTKWYIHNGLTYLVRFTFLEFMTPTPFNILFFKLMGMQVGKGVQINSSHISDPSLISIGDYTTVGGSATIVGHYGQKGFLVLAPVKIGAKCTIGLRAIVMGGAEIGDGATIMPNSVVLPKTQIPAGETWGGVPAQPIRQKKAA